MTKGEPKLSKAKVKEYLTGHYNEALAARLVQVLQQDFDFQSG